MKKLLVGLLALGSISTFASCNVYLNKKAMKTESKITKSLNLLGYNVVNHIDDADYLTNVWKFSTRDGLVAGLKLIEKDTRSIVFEDVHEGILPFYNLNPVLKEMIRTAPKCL